MGQVLSFVWDFCLGLLSGTFVWDGGLLLPLCSRRFQEEVEKPPEAVMPLTLCRPRH